MEGRRKGNTVYSLMSLEVGCMKLIFDGDKRHAALFTDPD